MAGPTTPQSGDTELPRRSRPAAEEAGHREARRGEGLTADRKLASEAGAELIKPAPTTPAETNADLGAKPEVRPDRNSEHYIPGNKWEKYIEVFDEAVKEAGISKHSPIVGAGRSLLMFLSANSGLWDNMVPGALVAGVRDKDSKYYNEKFSDKEAENILLLGERGIDNKPADGKFENIEHESVAFVAGKLGASGIINARYLLSRMDNWQKGGKKYFDLVDMSHLKSENRKEELPAGTVLFFVPDLMKNEICTAVSTGDDHKFWWQTEGVVKEFVLGADNSPIKTPHHLKAAYVPRFNSDKDYFAKHPSEIDGRIDDTVVGRAANEQLEIAKLASTLDANIDMMGRDQSTLKRVLTTFGAYNRQLELIVKSFEAILADKDKYSATTIEGMRTKVATMAQKFVDLVVAAEKRCKELEPKEEDKSGFKEKLDAFKVELANFKTSAVGLRDKLRPTKASE